MRRLHTLFVVTVLLLLVATSTQTYGQPSTMQATPGGTSEAKWENFDPRNFSNPTNVTHQWFPLKSGTQWTYDGITEDNGKVAPHHVVFTVTDLTKVIAGVRSVVVWEQDFSEGELVESETVFFAQANDGAVWQLGQYPEVYEKGKLTENPAWIHGVQEAHAGIVMEAKPQPGTPSFSQGWAPAVEYSDRAQTHQMGQETCVPAGCYKEVLVVKEYALDEPNAFQYKYYAPGVGSVRVGWSGEDRTKEKLELIKVVQLSAAERATANAGALSLEKHAYAINPKVYGQTVPMAGGATMQGTPAGAATPAVPPAATAAPTMQGTQAAAAGGPKLGHWEGKINRADGDNIVFDVMPDSILDNVEVEIKVGSESCTVELEKIIIKPDGGIELTEPSDTNSIQGKFDSTTTASGTVKVYECGGASVPATAGSNEFKWSAVWVSNEVGFGSAPDMPILMRKG